MSAKRTIGIVAGGLALLGGIGALGVVGVTALINSMSGPSFELDDLLPTPEPIEIVATPASAPANDSAWLDQTAEATGIPRRALSAYVAASVRAENDGCTVGWNTLAGIGWVESHHGALQGGSIEADGVARPGIIGIPLDGTNKTMEIRDTDGGAFDGDAEYDRAVGPLQFIPETWRIWGVDVSGDGVADPHNIDDAAATTARYLCRLDGTLETDETWIRAVRSYNDTLDYQTRVATAAARYADAVG
ncbi:MAG: lytic transglycosylase domain-containing protein [Microbacterium gubbeenense]|uniref:lytic transglycosylase domain-containing protein n=1 Tax=Microbacterium gubbeenense TaxID=159896 RepID=UPI003F9485A4